ncbi:MAG: dephospho-CoA kinase [Myxococcales bacterium]|nr:dephospho-CoA kinase [Myxococcales bacterium]
MGAQAGFPRLIGLTGGIASGKSTVSAMLRSLGAEVIDADQLARDVVEPGKPALEEIARRFPGTVDESGRLDRKKLGERVFADERERAALNAIVHPRIHEAVAERIRQLSARGVGLVIYDAPLLIENRIHEWMDGVILVVAEREQQLERVMRRDGLSREQAEARLSSQLPLDEKRRVATWVVDNSRSLDHTRAQVEQIWRQLEPLRGDR